MNDKIKELEEKLKTATGEEKISILLELAKSHYQISPDKVLNYAQEALKMAEANQYENLKGQIFNELGVGYSMLGDYSKGVENFEKSLECFKEIENRTKQANVLVNLGRVTSFQRIYEKSVDYFFEALKLYEANNDKNGLATVYVNLGGLYTDIREYKNAEKYLRLAIDMAQELKNDLYLSVAYTNLGNNYQELRNFSEALKYHLKALEIKEKSHDKAGIMYSYCNIGMIHLALGNYDEALSYEFKAAELAEEFKDMYLLAKAFLTLGETYLHLKDYPNCKEYLQKSIKIAQDISDKDILKDCYEKLSQMYYDTKDFEKSIDYYKLYDETKEQIFNAEKSKQIAELETRYETEKKEKEAEIYRLKNVELKNALDELKRTQKQLVEAEKMASLGNLVAGVAHEINTPVGIGITAISLIIDNGKDMAKKYKNDDISEEDFENFLESIDEAGQLVMKNLKRTSQLIASFRQVSVDQMVEEKRRFNVKSYLDDILLSLSPKFKGRNIQTELSCDDGLEIVSYPGVFAQIFTNFITNSLEYGFDEDEAGNITISVGKEMPSFQKMASLKIEYRDNGKGIPDDILPNIFDPFVSSNPQKGKGLGLHIVYNLVAQKLNGSIHCESKENEGTLFKIEIPLG